MLEVCFNDSVKGALLFAQNCKNDTVNYLTSIVTNKKGLFARIEKIKAIKKYRERQIQLEKIAVPLGGKPEDIAGISFGFSEGDIKSPISADDCPRKEYIREMLGFYRYNDDQDNTENAINEFWATCISDLQKIKSNPDKIRAWLDSTPDAQCGILFIADLLKNTNTEIHVIELPQKITTKDNIISEYRSWGEVEPQMFGTFLDKEKILSKNEVQKLAGKWQILKEENALLRVVKNGSVISTEPNYYDDLIRMEFPKGSCKVAHIIGCALGKRKILTGDIFIAKRIQNFIKNGELIVSDEGNEGFYSTTVTRAKRAKY